jgi:DNA-binding SARP family transcriptional activator
MRRFLYIAAIILFVKVSGFSQSYGLTFNSHEVVLEKRTSLDLSPEDSFCLAKNFDFSFDITFIPNHQIYFGYIIRIISNDNQNVDLIFNEKSHSFKVISGENFSGISFTIDSAKLYKDWNNINLKFNLDSHTLRFFVNGKVTGESSIPTTFNCLKFLFGANDFEKFKTRDIPPMKVKDIRIFEQNKLRYFWPLDETSGDICYDKINKKTAKAKNPVWLKPQYQKWEVAGSFVINGYASPAYDAKNDKLYIAGSDSLAVYDLKKEYTSVDWLGSHHQNLLMGNQAVYDTLTERFYDVYIDKKQVVGYNVNNQQWDLDFTPVPATEFWHANKFISPLDTSLYVIGGYGQLKYKNLVQRYHFATKKWEMLTTSGDYFPPRYLAALGTDAKGNFAYILGGYGSQTGDQMLDPKYYYDLFRFDVKRKVFKKMFSFKPLGTAFTFANSLITGPDPTEYYGLIFPNDSFNSNLQLIKGSLKDSTIQLLGNPIPYSFHDVQSFADLYYSPASNKLLAVTLFYSKEDAKQKNTEVKIYSLNFPPIPADATETAPQKIHTINYFYISLIAAVILATIVLVLRRNSIRRKSQGVKAMAHQTNGDYETQHIAGQYYQHGNGVMEKNHHPAIYLFGQFQVFDKDGSDITRLFTPLLKELFLVIAIYTIRNGRGISSEGLNEILWHDKSEKDAKNNRSVNIAKLKTILEKIGNCVITKESGYWQFQVMDENIHVDYKKFVSLLQGPPEASKEYIDHLENIIKRGAFLTQTEYNWLDNIKSEISNSVIDLCLGVVKNHDISKNTEWIIELTNYVFYFDPLNEDALTYKCKGLIYLKRHTLANNIYLKFVKEYKDIYGEEFSKSFHEIIT